MKISVIIPVYNLERWIDDCLSSVERQTWTDWECICVNDGSVDQSHAVLRAYEQRDARFKVVEQEHLGVGAARNHGLSKAKGEWIVFVDGDDVIDETWLETISRTADAHGLADIIVMPNGIVEFRDSDGIMTEAAKPSGVSKHKALSGGKARMWAQKRYSRDGWVALSSIRRSFIGKTRFDENVRIKEDVLFFLELSQRIDSIVISNFSGYRYRLRADSALHRQRTTADSALLLDALGRYPTSMCRSASRVAGWDIIQLIRDRGDTLSHDPSMRLLLQKWRTLVERGTLDVSEIYWWWRPGINHWLRTGEISMLSRTWKLRLAIARLLGMRG